MTKRECRDRMLALRRAQGEAEALAAGQAALGTLLSLPEFCGAAAVCSYLAMQGEVDTQPILEACREAGKQFFVVALCPDAGEYRPVEFEPHDTLMIGRFGVPEPEDKRWCDITAMDLVVVPGLAFDASGNRVGWGQGYYDRMLSMRDASRRSVTVGLAYDFQLLEEVPADGHDVPLDIVITEKRTVRCNNVAGS